MQRIRRTRGFTLLELSIVLTIIGLIVGGIVLGRSMIRQSQVTSVITDVATYTRVVNSFVQKYNALPGDMATATNFWGFAGGSTNDAPPNSYTTSCYSTGGTGTQTCNGDGNGQIGDTAWIPGGGSLTYANESFRVWQHLANAGFVTGSYTGLPGSVNAQDGIPGSNNPASRVDGAGYMLYWIGVSSGDTNYWDASYGHVIAFLGNGGISVLTAAEAAAVDQKSDDGKPGTGSILTEKLAAFPNCETTSVASTAVYNTSASGNQCGLLFITGF